MPVKKLVKRAKKGNKDAVVALIQAKKDDYYRLAFSYVKNEYDAMDTVTTMTIIVYEKINQLKKAEAFYSWSFTILVNVCKQLLREKLKLVPMEDVDDEILDGENQYEAFHQLTEIDYFLQKLTIEQRDVIILHYLHDFDVEMVADIVKVPVGTVKSRIFYGMRKLREIASEMRDNDGKTIQ